ncbi:mechanosensitive ion channel family protein [Sulfurovum sp. TSL1]|uniref:mechanosensitive ion channel family protein n=1 Tax=Sulfurovum sp. TSL1 TaxID=2826994 RepID=UPI001CC4F8A6|nr:mechanosensitive ion channel domain-containing protein [Sulfurovum sp. TSL1]GIT97695.1 mechanosensitive ion channel protein [Sulfurovum sp. TSL1]
MEVTNTEVNKYVDMAIQYGTEYGIKVIGAIAIFVIGKWVAHKISSFIKKLMERGEIDTTLSAFIASIIDILLMVVVVLAAINNLGVDTTSFIAILGAAGLAIGLALQGTFGNIGAGVILILFRPFEVGNFVTVAGESGTVEAITLFNTTLLTPDNKVILIPNSAVASGNITNFSKKEERRVDFVFGIGYDDDLKLAKATLQEIIDADTRILKDPASFIGVGELGDSSVNFTVRVWVKAADYWDVHFDTIEKVKLTFDEKGISIPYPQMDVHLDPAKA